MSLCASAFVATEYDWWEVATVGVLTLVATAKLVKLRDKQAIKMTLRMFSGSPFGPVWL